MIGFNSIHVSLLGRLFGLGYLTAQLTLFQKHLQYKPIANASNQSAYTIIPMVENIFTFSEDQKSLGYGLSLVNVLYMP